MGTLRLEPQAPQVGSPQPSGWEGLDGTVLLQNARWFTQVRWVAVVVLAGFGAATRGFPDALEAVGIRSPSLWPWALAGCVAAVNMVNIGWLRRISPGGSRAQAEVNLWFQIAADLVVLTVLVHLAGSLDTIVSFAYLFHIALACIFFARRESLVVLLLSTGLFLTVVVLEITGRWPARGILVHAGPRPPAALAFLTTALPTVFVWFVLWYFVSTISVAVRHRDRELDEANRQLRKADEEKNLQVLRVTHDLKAPFVGIESNIQVLKSAYWDALPEDVRKVVDRIEARGATLRARIGDILTLGNLRAGDSASPVTEEADLWVLLDAAIQDVQALASQRGITLTLRGRARRIRSDPRQLKILVLNLVTNAVSYSKDGGSVVLEVGEEEPARIRVIDRGIGISDEALPHIFEEYYRARDAAKANPQSTGLGLAIVRQVAQNLQLTVNVSSQQGEGTTFEVVFPEERRTSRGPDQDCG